MRHKTAALLTALSLLVLGGCCHPPSTTSLNVPLVPQHRDWWCWAATTEMISIYYNHRVDQCNSANFVHGTPPDCCTGCTGNCPCWGSGWGASLGDIENNWTNADYDYTHTPSSLTWAQLRETISTSSNCGRSPVQVVWWWSGGGGHVVTAYGYADTDGQQFVYYNDPWPPDCQRGRNNCSSTTGGDDAISTYAAFTSSTSHNWGNTFSRFRYTGP